MSTTTSPLLLNSTTTHTTLLTALPSSSSVSHIKQIHAQILRSNLSPSLLLKSLLSSSSSSSSSSLPSLHYALFVFTHLRTPHHPSLSNTLLRTLSRSANPRTGLVAYERIGRDGLFGIDRFSFPLLLKAAARVSGLNEGMEIHGVAAKLGFGEDPFVQTGLEGMYCACGRILDERLLFYRMSHRISLPGVL